MTSKLTSGAADDKSDDENDNGTGGSGGVLFYVNKDGFPMTHQTFEKMFNHCARIHPDKEKMVEKIQGNKNLPKVPIPSVPAVHLYQSVGARLEAIQDYMKELQYNHTGMQFYEIKKNRPLSGLMDSAKEMIRESLPIKCLEAVILGIYLTNGTPGLERFTISFKTQFHGNVHRHVVLGLVHNSRYGALGMSRREDLMDKPLEFKSLSELIFSYQDAYKKYWHVVKKLKVGLPIAHDPHSFEQIQWRHLSLNMWKMTRTEASKEIDKYAKDMRACYKSSRSGQSNYQFVQETNPYNSPRRNPIPSTPRVNRPSSPIVVRVTQAGADGSDDDGPVVEKRLTGGGYEIRI
nr:tubulinyl-Tyr carboxypeptidase 2-like [Lytechinus pictus]